MTCTHAAHVHPVLTWAWRARLHDWAPACSVAAAAAAEDVWRPGLCCPLPPTLFHLCCPSAGLRLATAAAASGPGHAAPAAPRVGRAVPPSPARGSCGVRPRLRARLRRALPTPPTRRLLALRAFDGRRSRRPGPAKKPTDVSLPQKSHHRRRVHQRKLVRSCPPLSRAAQALRSSSISAGGFEPGANRRGVVKVPLPSRWSVGTDADGVWRGETDSPRYKTSPTAHPSKTSNPPFTSPRSRA
jgi:hypothetical protein